jgi:hypothetical protein
MTHQMTTQAYNAAQELLDALGKLHTELSKVELPRVAERLADYAWNGYAMGGELALVEALHEISSADELAKANLMLPNGDELWHDEHRQLIEQLAKAAHAREALDGGDAVRVDALAALARVAEKTVRMSTNPAKPGSMRVRKDGHWAYIDAPEALAWLTRRNDFHPTRMRTDVDQQPAITDVRALAEACNRGRERTQSDAAGMASALGWTAIQRKAYEQIEAGNVTDQMTHFPPQGLLALGQHFALPQPQDFARQAFRVLALRHADTLADRQLATAPN